MRPLRGAGAAQDVLRGRARAQVADITRAVRARVSHWRAGKDLATAAPRGQWSQPAAPDAVTYPGRRVSTPGPLFLRRCRAFVFDNLPLLILVGLVLVSAVHTFVSVRAAAIAAGAVAALAVPIGGGMALHGLTEGRWPVLPRRRR